jgi:hypothetical protein
MLAIVRGYIADYQKLVKGETRLTNHSDKILQAQKNMQKHIEMLEQVFNKLKTDFNQYLAQKL